ncbi:MAG: fumarylacetoacetate hydrolase family protein [Bacteroidales bacterium]|jgi:2-keto-4-pentenoate hydratase/2-oxohepta-3-ene-1,7-dioic acid hydratase in catechol pathway|nr:fumarylacetoacetate hydrolase family protein [Bacteroidales bacterium]NLM91559.1 fumarylacetoacetate hydrolase family protein [Bacteroidales bacterium]
MKIICIGMNYPAHLAELNNPLPEEPVFFMKPETALIRAGLPFFVPDFSNEVHYEVELVLSISKLGKHIQERFAHTYYQEIGIGIDFTARDVQRMCREQGLPWEKAKAFDGSGPVSKFIPLTNLENPSDISFSLKKNGELVQQGRSSDMIFNFNQLISYVSKYATLKMGDMLFTGTPSGVGPVKPGDRLEAFLEDKKMLDIKVK